MQPKHYIIIGFLTMFFLFAGLSAFFFSMWRQSEKLSDQRYENLYQSLNESDQQIVLQTQAELAKLYPEIQALIDSLEIKHITQVHQTDYYYSTDSVITVLVPVEVNGVPSSTNFTFNKDTACLKISGIIDVPSREIMFSKISFEDEITTLYFWQRQRLFNWSWTPRWGKKQFRAKTHSNCTDSIKTIDIKINKQ